MAEVKRHARGMGRNLTFRVGLQAWYRYRTGVTNINGACSAWADQSGSMHPLVQATVSARPTVLSDGSLLFDGIAQTMAAAFTLVQPCTIFLAFRHVTWTANKVLFDGSTGTVKVSQATASPGLAANAGNALTTSNSIAVGARGIAVFTANGASSAYIANGGSGSVVTSADAGANNPGGVTLGSDRSSANFANINVYEMLVYSSALDAPTRHQINRYLGRVASVGGI